MPTRKSATTSRGRKQLAASVSMPLAEPNETNLSLPATEECCQAPCDPPWLTKPSCLSFIDNKQIVVDLPPSRSPDFGRGQVTITVTYEHRLCLIGKQHGGLAYTLTLLPGEKMTVYQSDRFRRVTSEAMRFSVQTTFSQFVSALHQQRDSNDSSSLTQLIDSSSSGSASAGGIGAIIPGLGVFGMGGAATNSSSHTSVKDLATHASSSQFSSIAEQASQYTDMQRSITVSTFEENESLTTTQRVLVNNNACYAVNYFVRKVLDVYRLTTTVLSVTFQVRAGKFVSPILTPDELGQLPPELKGPVGVVLKDLPKVGEEIEQARRITVPTDGVVYDPELSHCSSCEPVLEQAIILKIEREQAELQLLALEVQRRQALLAAGNLDPFDPIPLPPTATT